MNILKPSENDIDIVILVLVIVIIGLIIYTKFTCKC